MNPTSLSSMQIQETMARLSHFDGWRKDQLARLAMNTKQMFLPRRAKLVGKGDAIGSLCVVISGQVRLFIPLSNGSERVVSLIEKGQSFGEPCIIRAEPCPYEVVASKDSHLLLVDAMVYRRELRDSPDLMERTLNLLASRLLGTLRDIEICAQPSSLQKVAHFLIQLKPTPAHAGIDIHELEIRLPALKRDIAAKLGLTQETFSRMLAFLAQQGFIQLSGSRLRVDDWMRLHGLANAGCPMDVPRKN